MAKNYIGYTSIEELAKAVDKSKPVYCTAITNPGKGDRKFGVRIDTAEIVVAQPDDRGDVHYCLLKIGRWQALSSGHVLGEERKAECIKLQTQSYDLIKSWLLENGLQIRDALVALPTSLRLLEGWANFLAYDQETKAMKRMEPVA